MSDQRRAGPSRHLQPRKAEYLWQNIGLPLAEAFWKQDRLSDADRLLAETLGLGLDPVALIRTVRSKGFKELADHWEPPKAASAPPQARP